MVDLPIPQYPVTTTKQIQPGLSPAEIAQPYNELANTLKVSGDAAETVAKSMAEQAGAQAVSRDANGDIQVQKAPFIGPAAQVYEHAAKMAALTEADGESQRKVIDLRTQFKDDPQGFLAAVSGFAREQQRKLSAVAGPEVGNALFKTIDSYATQTYSGLQTEKQNLDIKNYGQTFDVGMKRAYDTLTGLARNGQTSPDDPAVKAALSQYETLQKQKMAIPSLGYTAAKAEYDHSQLLNEMQGNSIVHMADQEYQNAPSRGEAYKTAVDKLREAIFDPKLEMSQEDRQKYFGRGTAELRANEAVRHNDINELRAAWREIRLTPGAIDPAVVDKFRDQFKKLGSPMDVAMVDATAGAMHLLGPFLTEPLANQVQQQKIMTAIAPYVTHVNNAADAYGLPPELFARQLHQESGFQNLPPNAKGAAGVAQFIPGTAERYGVNRMDPASAIPGAAHYMSDLVKMFNGNYGLALAGYNWGEGNVQKWLAAGADPNKMPRETQDYIQIITGHPVTDFIGGRDVTKDITGGELLTGGVSVGAGQLEAADKALHFTPQERALYQRHLDNLNGPGGVDKGDARSSLMQATIQIDDKTYNIPTVWDGKVLPIEEAIDRAKAEGLDKFPSYPSRQAADERYAQMHAFMERDTEQFLNAREQRRVTTPAFRTSLQGAGVAGYVLSSQQREIRDNQTRAYKEMIEAWGPDFRGVTPSDKDLYTLLDSARLTGNADLAAKVTRDLAAIQATQGIEQMSLPQQNAVRQQLTQVIAGGGSEGALAEFTRKLADAKTSKLAEGLKNDTTSTMTGVFPDRYKVPAPLNVKDPQQLAAGVAYRGRIAQDASQIYQTSDVTALSKPDIAAVSQALKETKDPHAQAQIMQAIVTALPDEELRNNTLAKLGEKGPDEKLAAAAGAIMGSDPNVAEAVLRGANAMKAKIGYVPHEGTEKQNFDLNFTKYLPPQTFPLLDRTDPNGSYALFKSTVTALYADASARASPPDTSGVFVEARLKQAIEDATGGVRTHNGQTFIAPERGMTQQQVDAKIWGITDQDLAGVTDQAGNAITADYLRRDGKLESFKDGRYYLLLGNDPVHPVYAYYNDRFSVPQKFVLDMRGRKEGQPPIPEIQPPPTSNFP